jgi:hypothetical protein
LEPICFDAEFVGEKDIYGGNIHAENWYFDMEGLYFSPTHLFFSDNNFFKVYIRELARLSDPEYLNRFLDEIDTELRGKLEIIRLDYPDAQFNKELFYLKQQLIHKVLTFPMSIHPYFIKYGENKKQKIIEFNISNIRSIPIRILSLSLSDQIICALDNSETIIPPSIPGQPTATQKMQFTLPRTFKWKEKYASQLKINYTLTGLDAPQSAQVIPWIDLDENFYKNNPMNSDTDLKSLDFILIDEKAKNIYIKQGNWSLSNPYVFPKGYTVICKKNTRLNLIHSGLIISYSPFEFIGTSKDEHRAKINFSICYLRKIVQPQGTGA